MTFLYSSSYPNPLATHVFPYSMLVILFRYYVFFIMIKRTNTNIIVQRTQAHKAQTEFIRYKNTTKTFIIVALSSFSIFLYCNSHPGYTFMLQAFVIQSKEYF